MNKQSDDTTYKYYVIGESNPVRVTFNNHGRKIGAARIDPETGDFKRDNTLMSRIETSPDVAEIDQMRFEELRKSLSQKKITNQE